MPTIEIPMPSPRQKLFLKDQHKYVAFGGARGGGKSWAVRTCAVLNAYDYPGIQQMIIRSTYPELQKNHIQPLCEMLRVYDQDRRQRLASYNDQRKTLVFPNGSRIYFGYCDNDKDVGRYQGTEVDVLFIDEATHQTEERMDKLRAIVRGVNDFPKRIYYTCNPGGPGHGWVKRLFVDRQYRDNESPEEYSFIQSLVTDNEALMRANPDYIKQLEALPPKLREAWLHGRWDLFEGQFFEDFRTEPDVIAAEAAGCTLSREELKQQRRWTHVISPIDLSKGEASRWTILRSYDFGYGKPFSCAWWAVDYEGVLYRILELYGCTETPNEGVKWTPDKQFEEIARVEREHPWLKGKRIEGVADPAIWDASRGESIAETAMRYGISFTPGDNKRIPGWMQIHYRFQFDENGYARMYIFDNCKAFIRTCPLMMFDEHKVEDLDTDLEDHVLDETRYLVMSRPVKPIREVPKRIIISDPLNQFTERR